MSTPLVEDELRRGFNFSCLFQGSFKQLDLNVDFSYIEVTFIF